MIKGSGTLEVDARFSMATKYREHWIILHALLPSWKKKSLEDEPDGRIAVDFYKSVIESAEKDSKLL